MTEYLLLPHSFMFLCVRVLFQTLQDKVCEFQARLRSEEFTRRLLLQELQQQHSIQQETRGGGGGVVTLQEELVSAPPNGESRAGGGERGQFSSVHVCVLNWS